MRINYYYFRNFLGNLAINKKTMQLRINYLIRKSMELNSIKFKKRLNTQLGSKN